MHEHQERRKFTFPIKVHIIPLYLTSSRNELLKTNNCLQIAVFDEYNSGDDTSMIRVIFTTRTFYCRTSATLGCAHYKVI